VATGHTYHNLVVCGLDTPVQSKYTIMQVCIDIPICSEYSLKSFISFFFWGGGEGGMILHFYVVLMLINCRSNYILFYQKLKNVLFCLYLVHYSPYNSIPEIENLKIAFCHVPESGINVPFWRKMVHFV
jgi:hypothetical protein